PLYINYSVLYSNKELLNKYNKKLPLTWEALINTAQDIIKNEKDANDNIIGYAGLMPLNDESCLCSVYEFIYSYRNNINDTIPNYRSQDAIKAMDKIYYLKKNLSTDEIYKLNSRELFEYMNNNTIIFSKNWYNKELEDKYYISILPGYNENISGSTLNGNNIGINKYINKENKLAAIKVIEYFTSKETQMDYIFSFGKISGMKTIYDDQ
ncbi:hypothetical protein BCR36DRAFT_224354, partial [Piromyces finnis]